MSRNEAIHKYGLHRVLLLEKMELLPMGETFLATIELPDGDYLHREADSRDATIADSRYVVTT